MREGEPSLTAQRVAAYRVGFERLTAPYGDAAAAQRLERDVADSLSFTPAERMTRYLRGRTAFFDRVVVNGLERGVMQVAVIGAGYDARARRYAKPEVRWFELDHPATQADKRRRLERLGIEYADIALVALDLADGGTAAALLEAGWVPDAPSLMLGEGLSVYLEAAVLEALLTDLRSLVTVGTRLAISLPPPGDEARRRSRRAGFRESIAALGEPARNELTFDDAGELFERSRWRLVALSPRAQQAGFAVAAPVWEPAADSDPRTAARIGRYLEGLESRRGIDELPRHLSEAYATTVTGVRELDTGVFAVQRSDGDPWVTRVFPAGRPIADCRGDAEILRFLAQAGYPAERWAAPDPLTTYQGQGVLVTEHVSGRGAKGTSANLARLGDLLGRLHTLAPLPAPSARPGGGWHHLVSQGTPADEIAAAAALLDAAGARVPVTQRRLYQTLREALAQTEDCQGLPEALLHPDFVPANAVADDAGELTLVDWSGAGLGPRLWSLAFLLWGASFERTRAVESVLAGYRTHVELEPGERERLPGAIRARPIVFTCWAFATGREPLSAAADGLGRTKARADQIAERALGALG